MASGKLSPRQKMINMMYLVLTALLALNVSKEILDSFVKVNNSLETTKQAMKQNVQTIASDLAALAGENSQKYGAAWATAQDIQKDAATLVTYIDSIKTVVIMEADGRPREEIAANDTILNLKLVDKKDNLDAITHLMIGSEPGTPKDGPLSAKDLRAKLETFRDKIVGLAGEGNGLLAQNVTKMFTFPDEKEAGDSGPVTPWEVINFYHVPLAAGIVMLSKLQSDVRSAENETLNWLKASVEGKSLKFSTLTPIVDAESKYVTVGDSFRADIFLAAYDPLNKPIVELAKPGATVDTINMEIKGDKEVLPIGAVDGKGKLHLRAEGAGDKEYKGIITFKPVGGEEKKYPWKVNYTVAPPTLVVSPTKMNVFYRGVDNPVDISVPGYGADKIVPSMTNGTLSKAAQGYVVRPGKDNKAMVGVTVTNPDGSKRSMPGIEFRVKNVPNPTPYFAGKSVNDETIRKAELQAAQYVIAKMENFEFDLKFEVVEFQVTMIVSGTPIEKISKGAALTSDMKEMLTKAKPGQKVYIERIKAKGPDGTIRNLGGLTFKVT